MQEEQEEEDDEYGEEQKRDMMQAVKDLREIYGQEVDSDENVVKKGPFA